MATGKPLFEQELTSVDVAVRSPGFVIPRTVVEKYYYPKREEIPPEGIGFKEEEEWILLSDGDWITRMEFDPYVEGYKTMGNRWREYVKEHGLEAGDLIRFYRPLRPSQKYRFLIRSVKANKARVVGSTSGGSIEEEEEKARAKEFSKEGTHIDTEGYSDREKKSRGEEKTDIQVQEGRRSPSSPPADGSGKKSPLEKDIGLRFRKRKMFS